MNDKIKIIVVDDHQMFRQGLKFLLQQKQNFEIIGEAENGAQFFKLLETTFPDVVLMDIDMPVMDGISTTQKVSENYPNIKIIALTMFGEEHYYYQMISAGAKGFILKKSGYDELFNAIETVYGGSNYFSVELMRNIIFNIKKISKAPLEQINLTNRERDVLECLCKGMTAKEIADTLKISDRTVEVHKTKIFTKTNTKNTTSLVMFAIKENLVDFAAKG